jgi:FAD:protein FMN transferase
MSSLQVIPRAEAFQRFSCFGGACEVLIRGSGPAGSAEQAAMLVRRRLQRWHRQFSRFDEASELCRLNRDERDTVPVGPVMARFVEAAVHFAAWTGGLVDPTLIPEIEQAGYAGDRQLGSVTLEAALRGAPARSPGGPSPRSGWKKIEVDRRRGLVSRPPGVQLDSGGLAKGLFGDVLAPVLDGHASFAINAAGDVRFGGAAGLLRPVRVASPFEDTVLHTFELVTGAAATSGIGKRSWIGHDGRPAHHLLNPATGQPAFTGIVQVTALAPSGVEAEAMSKAALLSGPDGAATWLRHGGLVVHDDGTTQVIDPPWPRSER